MEQRLVRMTLRAMETAADEACRGLTPTEGRVLKLLTTALSLNEIAWILEISRAEVEAIAIEIYRKLELADTV